MIGRIVKTMGPGMTSRILNMLGEQGDVNHLLPGGGGICTLRAECRTCTPHSTRAAIA
jgi:hypothetical protein